MKSKILSGIIALFLCTAASYAQESGFGAKLGLNLADVTVEAEGYEDESTMRTSFHIGGYYLYMINEKIGIQPELVYSAQGAKNPSSTTTEFVGIDPITFEPIYATVTTPESTTILNYLNIPIIAKYYINESFDIHLGIQFGINMAAKSKSEDETTDIEDMDGMDMALPIGLGYRLESGLGFNARYNLGLSNIYKGEGEVTIKNNVIQISVSYNFTK